MATKFLDLAGLSTYDGLIKALIETYGKSIDVSINTTNYVMTISLKDANGNVLSTDTVDLPIESVVVNGTYDSTNQKIVLTLQNGNTIDIPVGALVSGLASQSDLDDLEDRVDTAESTISSQGTAISSLQSSVNAFPSNYVNLTGTQTIIGAKTFEGNGIYIKDNNAPISANLSSNMLALAGSGKGVIAHNNGLTFNCGGSNYFTFGNNGGTSSSPKEIMVQGDMVAITTSEINNLFS